MRIALLTLLFAATAVAQTPDINADRPGIADGSATIASGKLQIESGFELDHPGQEHDLYFPTLVRWGVTPNFEARIETNTYQRGDGWQPVSIGGKYHFHDAPSLGVIARAFVVNSHPATGDVRLAEEVDLNDRWSINPNVGVALPSDRKRFVAALAALTVQYNVSNALNVFADGGAQTPEARHGTTAMLVDGGTAWIVGKDIQLDASIGWGAHGSTTPRVFWSAGLSRRF